MRPQFRLLAAAGLALSALTATGAILALGTSVQASSLPEATTIRQAVRSSDKAKIPVREVRAVRPDRYTGDSCQDATWPYIPERCLRKAGSKGRSAH